MTKVRRFAPLFLASILILPLTSARGQNLEMSKLLPTIDAQAAFDDEYGKAVVEAIAALLVQHTDESCRRQRGLGPAEMRGRVQSLMIGFARDGEAPRARLADSPAYADKFIEKNGRESFDAWLKLLVRPEARKYFETTVSLERDALVASALTWLNGVLSGPSVVRPKSWTLSLFRISHAFPETVSDLREERQRKTEEALKTLVAQAGMEEFLDEFTLLLVWHAEVVTDLSISEAAESKGGRLPLPREQLQGLCLEIRP